MVVVPAAPAKRQRLTPPIRATRVGRGFAIVTSRRLRPGDRILQSVTAQARGSRPRRVGCSQATTCRLNPGDDPAPGGRLLSAGQGPIAYIYCRGRWPHRVSYRSVGARGAGRPTCADRLTADVGVRCAIRGRISRSRTIRSLADRTRRGIPPRALAGPALDHLQTRVGRGAAAPGRRAVRASRQP